MEKIADTFNKVKTHVSWLYLQYCLMTTLLICLCIHVLSQRGIKLYQNFRLFYYCYYTLLHFHPLDRFLQSSPLLHSHRPQNVSPLQRNLSFYKNFFEILPDHPTLNELYTLSNHHLLATILIQSKQ
ncbi:hypothetical protein BpHYR1_017874 [Brachionus plicatilis]|uniref:Uncharacterized protein n=1 Tax=Brachionus plicatilis TaxID=10195 RepID=A0A3M7RM78_BRAPC|nr:hypothetical protein BpHYR1_017874 [Brachionus plicatilis]